MGKMLTRAKREALRQAQGPSAESGLRQAQPPTTPALQFQNPLGFPLLEEGRRGIADAREFDTKITQLDSLAKAHYHIITLTHYHIA